MEPRSVIDVADADVEAAALAFLLGEEGLIDAFGRQDAPFDEDAAQRAGADVIGVGGGAGPGRGRGRR